MKTQVEKAEAFAALHAREGAFVIPNPWDIGSARLLAGLGFEALATTSSGFAHALGRLDGEVSRDQVFDHCRALCAATEVPVSADLENGFGHTPEAVAESILRVAETGVAGASIEDYTGDPDAPLYAFDLAVERVQAAVEAARSLGFPFVLTARAEALLRGGAGFDDTLRRLQAFEAVGADVLYAPGLKTLDEVRTLTSAVGRPVNVLAPPLAGVTVAELADAGVRRISVGGALARAAIATLLRAGGQMLEQGRFDWTSDLASAATVADLLGAGDD
jgi:2-methylisocitrate lyase-like PEP mutase family enzyme